MGQIMTEMIEVLCSHRVYCWLAAPQLEAAGKLTWDDQAELGPAEQACVVPWCVWELAIPEGGACVTKWRDVLWADTLGLTAAVKKFVRKLVDHLDNL